MVDRYPAMLDYEWGNPSTVIISGGENHHDPFATGGGGVVINNESSSLNLIYHHHHHHPQSQHFQLQPPPPPPPLLLHDPHNLHPSSIYDPRAFAGASSYAHPYSVEQHHHPHQSGFMVVPKSEPSVVVGGGEGMSDLAATIGLNLGGRTYFSAADDHDFVNRLYRRSRGGGGGGETAAVTVNAPRCQAEGCNADLSHGKHYHRRHKVCEFHSKAATVLAAGLTQRFCQQCSRFHPLNEFDNGKRSCRKRLADHNRRRRKSHQPPPDKYQSASRSPAPAESGVNLDCFGGRRQQTSLFYSNG